MLTELFAANAIGLAVGEKQITISDETYDVQVVSGKSKILIPVKTRETMGGGHANLFTRDIHKSISVAQENGYLCIPIVIAESWGGDLDSLHCEHLIYIQANPNQTDEIGPKLADVFKHKRGVCQDFAHLAIGCLRSLGYPARYVSGYLETLPPPGKEKLVGADATHAWFAVYSPGEGWFEFDPTNNTVTSEQHITTAWGRDYSDVTPLKGVIFGGGHSPQLCVSVDVQRITE